MSEMPQKRKKKKKYKGITLPLETYQLLVRSKSILQIPTGEQMTWDAFFNKLIELVPQYKVEVKEDDRVDQEEEAASKPSEK